MATLLKATGESVEIHPKTQRFTLEELQQAVGGTIDMVYLPTGEVMVINDNGKCENQNKNEAATLIWCAAYPIEQYPHNNDQLIVGDVIFFEVEELDEIKDEEEDPEV